jgi:hypothetical protein
MNSLPLVKRGLVLAVAMCLIAQFFAVASDDPALTKEQIKQFLLTAKIVNSREVNKGITHTQRLTLSNGILIHDASFQTINEHKSSVQLSAGTELNFVDSYKYNIAAYKLAELLGVDDMLPVYVERKWKGDSGSLSWWLPVKMDEVEYHKENLAAPDPDAWNNQMYRIRVFDELIYDSDPNRTNVLIGEDWKIWRIDFTRAFRLSKKLKDVTDLVRCDRQLFEKLKTLDAKVLAEKTKGYLVSSEVDAVMSRRDKIVEQFQRMIAEKGEKEILY